MLLRLSRAFDQKASAQGKQMTTTDDKRVVGEETWLLFVCLGLAWLVLVGRGWAWLVLAGRGLSWLGVAGRGSAWLGWDLTSAYRYRVV